jgi:hypothetical protein
MRGGRPHVIGAAESVPHIISKEATGMTDRKALMPPRPVRRVGVIVAAGAVLAALSSSGAAAQTLTDPHPKPSAPPAPATTKSRPTAHVKNCSIYGPGFMAMPGTDTCIKIGGGVTVEGTSRR